MANNSNTYLTFLHFHVTQRLSLEEIRTICFKLNVDFENIPGEEKSSKVRELLIALERKTG